MRPGDYFSSSVANLFSQVLGIVTGVASARLLGPQGRGELTAALYLPTLVGTYGCLGLPSAAAALIAKGQDPGTRTATHAVALSALQGFCASVLLTALFPLRLIFAGARPNSTLRLLVLSSCVMAVIPTIHAVLRALGKVAQVNALVIMAPLGYLGVLAVLSLFNRVGAIPVAACLVALTWLSAAAGTLMTRSRKSDWCVWGRPDAALFLLGGKLFGPVVSFSIYFTIDRAIFLASTSAEQLGFYTVAASVALPVGFLAEPFVQIGFVEFASAGKHLAGKVLAARLRTVQQVVIVVAAALTATAGWVVPVAFGPAFSKAVGPARLLALVMVVRVGARVIEAALRAQSLTLPGSVAYGVGSIVLACLGFLMTARSGALGFSGALLIAEIVTLVILLYFGRRHLGLRLRDLNGLSLNGLRESLGWITGAHSAQSEGFSS